MPATRSISQSIASVVAAFTLTLASVPVSAAPPKLPASRSKNQPTPAPAPSSSDQAKPAASKSAGPQPQKPRTSKPLTPTPPPPAKVPRKSPASTPEKTTTSNAAKPTSSPAPASGSKSGAPSTPDTSAKDSPETGITAPSSELTVADLDRLQRTVADLQDAASLSEDATNKILEALELQESRRSKLEKKQIANFEETNRFYKRRRIGGGVMLGIGLASTIPAIVFGYRSLGVTGPADAQQIAFNPLNFGLSFGLGTIGATLSGIGTTMIVRNRPMIDPNADNIDYAFAKATVRTDGLRFLGISTVLFAGVLAVGAGAAGVLSVVRLSNNLYFSNPYVNSEQRIDTKAIARPGNIAISLLALAPTVMTIGFGFLLTKNPQRPFILAPLASRRSGGLSVTSRF